MTLKEIKEFMKRNKITYAELSQRSGIPEGTLKHIFAKAETANPQLFTMQAIERALGLTPTSDEIAQGISAFNLTADQNELLMLYDAIGDKFGSEVQKSLILYARFCWADLTRKNNRHSNLTSEFALIYTQIATLVSNCKEYIFMNAEKMILLSQKLVMISLASDDENRKKLLEEIAILNKEISDESVSKEKTVFYGALKFTEQEISKMPKRFQKEFRVDGCTAHIRKRCDDRYNCSYEIRYRRNGYNISVSARTLEQAKEKFIQKLKTAEKVSDTTVPTLYNDFSAYFFENYYKERVAPETYDNARRLFERWIKPYFEAVNINKITPGMCKTLLQGIKDKGLGKTADDVHSLLNQTLKHAIAYNIIQRNPLAVVSHKQHERKNGKRLTLDEEKRLISESRDKYRPLFAVYLYAGIRPGEIYSLQIGEKFITCQNLKQKNQKIEYKKIPIINKLRPFLGDIPNKIPKLDYIRNEFRRILPDHTLKDCRRTFSSHCVECKVDDAVREKMLGHAPKNALDRAYVEFTDDYILQEAQKLEAWNLPPNLPPNADESMKS